MLALLYNKMTTSLRQRIANWLLRDIHVSALKFGDNSVIITNKLNVSAAEAATANGDLGRDVSNQLTVWKAAAEHVISTEAAAETLTNKTLTTPTIGSFTNSAHTHQDAAGGAQLDHGLALTGLGDDDHTQYSLADGTRAFTGVVAGVSPTGSTHLVTKDYVDTRIAGSVAVGQDGSGYLGTGTVAEINALTPVSGDAAAAEDAGTPSAGTSDLLAAGDLAEYDGTQWKKIVSNSGGFVPSGTRAIVATSSTFIVGGGLTSSSDEGKIVAWDGTAIAHTSNSSPVDGVPAITKGEGSVNENRTFIFDGVVPTGAWVLGGGVGTAHSALTGLTSGDDHTQYTLLAGRSGGQALVGGSASGNGLTLESTSNATKGTIDFISGSDVRMMGDDEWVPNTTGQGSLGTASKKFLAVNALTVTSGDLHLRDDERDAHWVLREELDGITLFNVSTQERFRMNMTKVVD